MLTNLKRSTLLNHIFLIFALTFIVFISLLWSDSQSLIAHDEGLYARRAKFLLESGNWLSPFSSPHHKTVGSYWTLAISLKLFGISDWASRLPSTVAGLIATLFFYFTALKYFKPLNSLMASLALMAMPMYFQSLRTAGPDMVFIALLMAQIYFLVSADDVSYSLPRWRIFGFGACVALAFFVRSLVAVIPLLSLLPLIFVRRFLRFKSFWFWAISGLLLGSIPLLLSLLAVFSDHGYAGIVSLISFASKKADMTEWNLYYSIPFYFSRLILLTFPACIFLVPRIKASSKKIFSSKIYSLQMELNSVTVFFPLIYLFVLSCMGARHYHYLIPLVPMVALNIARIDLISKRSQFRFEANFAGFLGVLYLLGAFMLIFNHDDLQKPSLYLGLTGIIFSSISCWYAFFDKAFVRRKVTPFALIFIILMSQYLTLFALSSSGIIWNTNNELKLMANSINNECKWSGAYLYRLDSKDMTILRFYLDDAYVLRSLEDSSASPRRCLVSVNSAKKELSQDLQRNKFSKIYFR